MAGEAWSSPGSHQGMGGEPEPCTVRYSVNIHPSRGAVTYASSSVSPFFPTWTSLGGASMSAPLRRGEHSSALLCLLFTMYGVGGPHRTTTLITVSLLPMPRPLIQQAGLSWTSDICERGGNCSPEKFMDLGDVKVTDEDVLLCWTNRVADQLLSVRPDRPAKSAFSFCIQTLTLHCTMSPIST